MIKKLKDKVSSAMAFAPVVGISTRNEGKIVLKQTYQRLHKQYPELQHYHQDYQDKFEKIYNQVKKERSYK